MIGAVDAVLHEIGADDVPVELVLNKIDQVDPLGRRRLSNRFPGSLQISAATGEGVEELRARIAHLFADRFEDVRLLLPYEEGGKLAELYAGADRRARGLRAGRARARPAAAARGPPLRRLSRCRRERRGRARRQLAVVAAALKDRCVLPRRELLEIGLGELVEVEAGLGRELGHVPEHVAELGGYGRAPLLG